MEIRKIDKSESHLVIALFDKYRVFYEQDSDLPRARKFIQERLENNESVIFVAIDKKQQKPVGFTQLYAKYSSVKTIRNWILNDLYVEPGFRNKGVGKKLIMEAMDFARKKGSKSLELSTAVDNLNAQSLYEKIGFNKQMPGADFFTYRISLD